MTAVLVRQPTTLADWQDKTLDRAVRDFLAITQDANERILDEVLEAVGEGRSSLLRLPLTNDELGAFARLADLLGVAWQEGSETLARRLGVRFAAVTAEDLFVPPPREFLDLYRRRELRLAGVYEADRLDWVQNVVARSQVRGLSPADTREIIGRRFPGFTDARLRNIGRTESALLYEHGRVGRMQASEFVQGYTFVAVIDGRTTDVCASRDGKVYGKADAPVPPLHFQCRSDWEPIFVGEEFDPREVTQRELDSPPFEGFGRRPDIAVVQPAARIPVTEAKLPTEEWIASLTDREREAIDYYSSTFQRCSAIREADKTGQGSKEVLDHLRHLDAALDRSQPYTGDLYRAIAVSDDVRDGFLLVDDIVLDSLQSAAIAEDDAAGFVTGLMTGKQPPGAGIMLRIVNNKTGVDTTPLQELLPEVILRKDTRYRILSRMTGSVEDWEGGRRMVLKLTLEEL